MFDAAPLFISDAFTITYNNVLGKPNMKLKL